MSDSVARQSTDLQPPRNEAPAEIDPQILELAVSRGAMRLARERDDQQDNLHSYSKHHNNNISCSQKPRNLHLPNGLQPLRRTRQLQQHRTQPLADHFNPTSALGTK